MPLRALTPEDGFVPLAASTAAPRAVSNRSPVDDALVRAVIQVESGGRPDAISPRGARGPMQLMPATARELGVDPNDPAQNVEGGTRYLSQLHGKYQDRNLALMAYNWGPGNVDKWLAGGGRPERVPKETRDYVQRVTAALQQGANGDQPAEQVASARGRLRPLTPEDGFVPLEAAPIGAGRAALQGAFQGVRDTAAGLVYSGMGAPLRVAGAVLARDPKGLLDPNIAAGAIRGVGDEYLAPPSSPGEAYTQAATRGVVGAIPTAGAGVAGGVTANVLGGATGAVSSEWARRAGLPGWAQIALGIGGGLVPSAITGASRAVGNAVVPSLRNEQATLGAAARLGAAVHGQDDVRGLLDRTIARNAQAEAAAAGGGTVPPDLVGRPMAYQEIVAARPGSVGNEPGLLDLVTARGRASRAFAGRVNERIRENVDALEPAAVRVAPGNPSALPQRLTAAEDAMEAEVRRRYGQIDWQGLPETPVTPFSQIRDRIMDETTGGARLPMQRPAELADVARWEARGATPMGQPGSPPAPAQVGAQDLERLRKSIVQSQRLAAARPELAPQGANLMALKGQVESSLDDIAARGGPEAEAQVGNFRAALQARRAEGEIFGDAHPLMQAVRGREDVVDGMKRVFSSTARPTDEARNLMRAVARDAEGQASARAAFWRSLFGGKAWDELTEANVRSIGSRLARLEGPGRVILGDDGYDLGQRFLTRLRTSLTGKPGTRAAVESTGSGVASEGTALQSTLEIIMSPRRAITDRARQRLTGWLEGTTLGEQNRILEDALIDPVLMRQLLNPNTQRNASTLAQRVSRNAARQGLNTTVREISRDWEGK